MSGYLLDTNVISMLSPSRADAPAGFLAWLDERDAEDQLFLSVVTIHEIEKGIGLLESRKVEAKARALRLWLSGLVSTYDDRILPIDAAVASLSGRLEAAASSAGYAPGMADALIAGTASAHELTLVTRNLRHFEPFGIALLAPENCRPGS